MNPLTDIEHELRLAAEWALLRCQRAAIAPSEALEAVWRALGVSMLRGSTEPPRGSNGFVWHKPDISPDRVCGDPSSLDRIFPRFILKAVFRDDCVDLWFNQNTHMPEMRLMGWYTQAVLRDFTVSTTEIHQTVPPSFLEVKP